MGDQDRRIKRAPLTIASELLMFHLVTATGELNGSNAHDLERKLIQLEADGRSVIVLDLRQLELIDSTGLAVILRAHRRMADNAHSLSIVRPQGQVGRAFELTGLDQVLAFAD
jgi:anti-sigma B factor antagonist